MKSNCWIIYVTIDSCALMRPLWIRPRRLRVGFFGFERNRPTQVPRRHRCPSPRLRHPTRNHCRLRFAALASSWNSGRASSRNSAAELSAAWLHPICLRCTTSNALSSVRSILKKVSINECRLLLYSELSAHLWPNCLRKLCRIPRREFRSGYHRFHSSWRYHFACSNCKHSPLFRWPSANRNKKTQVRQFNRFNQMFLFTWWPFRPPICSTANLNASHRFSKLITANS